MHFYPHSIGDYRRDTMHLTLLEHGAYRQLLDLYYLNECELDANALRLICARSEDEIRAAQTVLDEFFEKTENGYKHKRCEAEIAKYRQKSDKAKASAEARWGKKQSGNKERNANAMRTHNGRNANQEPRTKNQYIESTNVDSCSKPLQASTSPPVISIPTNRYGTKGEEYPVTQQQVDDWSSSYPAVDVMQQLRTMRSWSTNNPTKRKTVKGMPKFIDSWLSREQDKGGKNETHQRTDQHETHHQRITRLIHAGC
jgi:uncharacterized protein YdaU (DUF1376 family)